MEATATSRKLTKNEALVYDALKESEAALKAYDLLDRLRERGVRAPMTVYRALDGLTSKGLVHKIDALNAFVPCTHRRPHAVQTFLMCKACEKVEEVASGAIEESAVAPAAAHSGFQMTGARLEILGVCADCAPETHSAH